MHLHNAWLRSCLLLASLRILRLQKRLANLSRESLATSASNFRQKAPDGDDNSELEEPHVQWVIPLVPVWAIWGDGLDSDAEDPEDNGGQENEDADEEDRCSAAAIALVSEAVRALRLGNAVAAALHWLFWLARHGDRRSLEVCAIRRNLC